MDFAVVQRDDPAYFRYLIFLFFKMVITFAAPLAQEGYEHPVRRLMDEVFIKKSIIYGL